MTLTPNSWEELATALQAAGRAGTTVGTVSLARLDRVRRYAPEDLTVTVETGITLGALQTALRQHGQWLPIDPPGADSLSMAEILDWNLSGPRRHGYGTLREHLLGVRVVLADGRIIRSGGEVVKNVAGYDLLKLFVGAGRSLGVVVEAAFKVQAVPAHEAFVVRPCGSWEDAAGSLEHLGQSPVTPIVFDLHNVDVGDGRIAEVVLGFAGSMEEVEWQLEQVRPLGFVETTTLRYATAARQGLSPASAAPSWSVLPSRLIETLRSLGGGMFVARAGLGVVESRGPITPPTASAPPGPTAVSLMRRVKTTFDPAGVLPALPSLTA